MVTMIDASIVGLGEAASLLGLTESRVRQLLRSRQMVGQKLNQRAWAISAAEVARYKAARERRGKTSGRPTKAGKKLSDFTDTGID